MAPSADFSLQSKNGITLLEHLEDCIDCEGLWQPSKQRLKIMGGPQVIEIQPNPKKAQSGNGLVSIGGNDYKWNDLKPTLKSSGFAAKYEAFLEKSEAKWLLKAEEFATCVLLLFEIARRKNGDQYGGVHFLSRDETDHAIEEALNNGLEDDLIQVFTATDYGTTNGETYVQMRRSAYYRIINHETSSTDDMILAMARLSTNLQLRRKSLKLRARRNKQSISRGRPGCGSGGTSGGGPGRGSSSGTSGSLVRGSSRRPNNGPGAVSGGRQNIVSNQELSTILQQLSRPIVRYRVEYRVVIIRKVIVVRR